MIPNPGSLSRHPAEATAIRDRLISVIVPVVRADDRFRACLASLARLDPRCLDLVVVVDGGDAEAAVLAADRGARVVRLPQRLGPAAARNAGARIARGDLLLFVDADVALPRDALARVAGAFEAHAGCDAVIGSYDAAPAAPDFLSQCKNLVQHFIHQTSNEEACTFWGACGAVTRAAFESVGGFDERFTRSSMEDIELGFRLVAAGYRIRLEKALQVTHLKRWTTLRLIRSEIFDRAIPWTRLILRTRHMPNDLNLRWSGRVAVVSACLLAGALVAALRHPWAWLAAAALAGVQISVDVPLLRFLRARRGTVFAAGAIGWQWVHYLCCAAGFAGGVILYLVDVARSRADLPVSRTVAPLPADKETE